jgi:hypothetical protein
VAKARGGRQLIVGESKRREFVYLFRKENDEEHSRRLFAYAAKY